MVTRDTIWWNSTLVKIPFTTRAECTFWIFVWNIRQASMSTLWLFSSQKGQNILPYGIATIVKWICSEDATYKNGSRNLFETHTVAASTSRKDSSAVFRTQGEKQEQYRESTTLSTISTSIQDITKTHSGVLHKFDGLREIFRELVVAGTNGLPTYKTCYTTRNTIRRSMSIEMDMCQWLYNICKVVNETKTFACDGRIYDHDEHIETAVFKRYIVWNAKHSVCRRNMYHFVHP